MLDQVPEWRGRDDLDPAVDERAPGWSQRNGLRCRSLLEVFRLPTYRPAGGVNGPQAPTRSGSIVSRGSLIRAFRQLAARVAAAPRSVVLM